MTPSDIYSRIYAEIRRIPPGRVATYGQIAVLASLPGHARQVGYALSALNDDHDVPWHRVLNAKGRISRKAESMYDDVQQALLEAEGVEFGIDGVVSLAKYGWKPARASNKEE